MTSLSLEQFRARFPIFRERVYVNSCSQGALSSDVEQAFHAYLDSWHREGSPWEHWVEESERLRGRFAALVGATPDEIAIVPSASAGIGAIASALAFDGARDTVVLGEFEFPTMAHAWLAQQRRGARIVWARARGEALELPAYAGAIDERTLIVPATHVCFRNGFRSDLPALARICRERGAYLLLDDYQRTGTGALDVHALGVDFMVTGCLKYLLGPAGIAFLYVRRALVERLQPTITGWFGRVNPFAYSLDPLDWSPSARRFEGGTPPIPNAFAALAGIGLLQAVGLPAVEARIHDLTARLIAGASAAGFRVATPKDPAQRGPLVVLRASDGPQLVSRLKERGIIASSRGDGLRVSWHAYNDTSDVDAVLAALQSEAALLQRAETSTGSRA